MILGKKYIKWQLTIESDNDVLGRAGRYSYTWVQQLQATFTFLSSRCCCGFCSGSVWCRKLAVNYSNIFVNYCALHRYNKV